MCACGQGVWIYLALYNSMGTAGMGVGMGAGSRRQEMLVALVQHVSSPVQREVDSGLCVLSSLANAEHVSALQDIHQRCHPGQQLQPATRPSSSSSSSSLRVFLPFIKSLLEDVRTLKENQQRILFRYCVLLLLVMFCCCLALFY